jgi:hypothetical protein
VRKNGRGRAGCLAVILGLAGVPLASSLAAGPAAAARVERATLAGSFELCILPPTPTTSPSTTTTTASSTTGGVTTTIAPLAPYIIVLLPPPSYVTLSRGGHTIASTSDLSYFIPPNYRNTGHPDGPSGFNMSFTLLAPPGHYVLKGIFGRRQVTLVAGHVNWLDIRQGDCW